MSRFTNSPLFHAPYQLWSTSDWSRVSTTTSNIATCGGKVAISKATSASSSTVIILRLSRIHTPFRKNISGVQATTCDAVIAAFQYRHVHQPHQPEFRGRTRRCPRSDTLCGNRSDVDNAPPLCGFTSCIARCVHRKGPRRFVLMTQPQDSKGSSSIGPPSAAPALLTSRWSWPNSIATRSNNRSTVCGCDTSPETASTRAPIVTSSSLAADSLSALRTLITSAAATSASPRQMARPIP